MDVGRGFRTIHSAPHQAVKPWLWQLHDPPIERSTQNLSVNVGVWTEFTVCVCEGLKLIYFGFVQDGEGRKTTTAI